MGVTTPGKATAPTSAAGDEGRSSRTSDSSSDITLPAALGRTRSSASTNVGTGRFLCALLSIHNANALPRHSAVVLQKSIREGVGLTVTEAMWKGAAVIGGNVGGIRRQIEDGKMAFWSRLSIRLPSE